MNEPNIIEKAKNLTGAMANWASKDGFSGVSREQFSYRKNICSVCPNWDQSAYANIGKCRICGCSIAKLYIPSSICPDNPPRWFNISASYTESTNP